MNFWGKPGRLSALALSLHLFLLYFQCRINVMFQMPVSALLAGHTRPASLVTKADIQLTGSTWTLAVGILLVHLQWLPYLGQCSTLHICLGWLWSHLLCYKEPKQNCLKGPDREIIGSPVIQVPHYTVTNGNRGVCWFTDLQLVLKPIQDREDRIGIYSSQGLTLA